MTTNFERQEVKPKSGAQYDDSFYSHVYNTNVQFGLNEQRLLWTRFAGFLVLQGFILNALRLDSNTSEVVLLLSMIGVICSVVWHILNHAGWLNQNVWFSKAAGLSFSYLHISMPTDWWVDHRALKPTGKIYKIAQLVPLSFIAAYSYTTNYSLKEIMGSAPAVISNLITGILIIVAFLTFIVVERAEYAERKSIEDGRPLS